MITTTVNKHGRTVTTFTCTAQAAGARTRCGYQYHSTVHPAHVHAVADDHHNWCRHQTTNQRKAGQRWPEPNHSDRQNVPSCDDTAKR